MMKNEEIQKKKQSKDDADDGFDARVKSAEANQVRSVEETDVNEIAELSNNSNIPSNVDYVTASEDDENCTSMGDSNEKNDASSSGNAAEPSEMEAESHATTDITNGNVGEPSEMETEPTAIPSLNAEDAEIQPPTDQEESDEVLNKDKADTVAGGCSEMDTVNDAILNPDAENRKTSPPSGEAKSTDAVPSEDGSSNVCGDEESCSNEEKGLDVPERIADMESEDNLVKSADRSETISKSSADDTKICAIPASVDSKDDVKDIEGSVTTPSGTSTSTLASLKGTSATYSSVASALKVAIPSKCIHNADSATVQNMGSQKRVEKFSIKNVSKVSKIFKVSNLSYKIKPVLKSAAFLDCPIVYVGEPAFVDIEDFTDPMNEENNGLIQEDLSKSQADIADWANSMPSAYATSMVKSTTAAPAVQIEPSPSIVAPTNVARKPVHPQLYSPYSFPPYIITHAENRKKMPEKKTAVVNAVPHQSQKQNPAFQHGTAFRIVARPAPRAITTDPQKLFKNTVDLATLKPTPTKPPVTAKVVSKVTAVINNLASSSVVSIAKIKPATNIAVITAAQTKPIVLHTTGKNQTLAMSIKKVHTPQKMQAAGTMKVNVLPAQTGITKLKIAPKVLPLTTTANKLTAATNTPAVYKNTSTVYIKSLVSPKSTQIVNSVNHSTKVAAEVEVPDKNKRELEPTIPRGKSLRAGVEVAFEDGVRHFISNLRNVTHQDDEPVLSWTELKKGTKVAATWTDGHIYDATVVACYFPTGKQMQPVVPLESPPVTIRKSKPEQENNKTKNKIKLAPAPVGKKVGCTRCRKVFTSIGYFREHQRSKCNSMGVIVPNAATEVTDQMISATIKEDNERQNNSPKSDSKTQPIVSQGVPLPSQSSPPKSVKRPVSNDTKMPPRKKTKPGRPVTKSLNSTDIGDEAIFNKGTKFLHRWQLDGGESRWYQGEVQSILSNKGSFLNWEFEVCYKGEDDNYVLKLYEDFPSDIRIIGKM